MQYSTVILVVSWCLQIVYAENETCTWHGVVYQAGDSVTGDPCDQCTCTQFGVMCALIHCPRPLCFDDYHPEGECCPSCPNGNNCLYHNNRVETVIPQSGCQLNKYTLCFCRVTPDMFNRLQPFCLPFLPFFRLPACKSSTG